MFAIVANAGGTLKLIGTAEAALATFDGRPLTVPLTDMPMRGNSGAALGEALHGVRPEVPLVVSSGNPAGLLPEQLRSDPGLCYLPCHLRRR